jgi:hypothetical protein
LANNAQAIRAILLACAMATTLNGRRASICVTQGYLCGLSLARRRRETAPPTRIRRKYRSPCFEIGPNLGFPPVEFCRGTSPIQAAKSRPDWKAVGSVTVAAMAVVVYRCLPGQHHDLAISCALLAWAARYTHLRIWFSHSNPIGARAVKFINVRPDTRSSRRGAGRYWTRPM